MPKKHFPKKIMSLQFSPDSTYPLVSGTGVVPGWWSVVVGLGWTLTHVCRLLAAGCCWVCDRLGLSAGLVTNSNGGGQH